MNAFSGIPRATIFPCDVVYCYHFSVTNQLNGIERTDLLLSDSWSKCQTRRIECTCCCNLYLYPFLFLVQAAKTNQQQSGQTTDTTQSKIILFSPSAISYHEDKIHDCVTTFGICQELAKLNIVSIPTHQNVGHILPALCSLLQRIRSGIV